MLVIVSRAGSFMVWRRVLFWAIALTLVVGCGGEGKADVEVWSAAKRISVQAFNQHLSTGNLCPSSPAEVWAYPNPDDTFPSPAGQLEDPSLAAPFVTKIPFWCAPTESPSQVTKAKAVVTVTSTKGMVRLAQFEVEDLGALTLAEQGWSWVVAFVLAQVIVFFVLLNGIYDLKWRAWATGLFALPVGGYMAYRTFNGALAVVLCLLLQVVVSAALLAVVVRMAQR
jgi:hypothetical protein